MVYRYNMPGTTLIGIDSSKEIGFELSKRKAKKCLLVTDEYMIKSAVADSVSKILQESGIETIVYGGVKPNPTISQIKDGTYLFIQNQCDCILSLGGGSPHDCAKGIKISVIRGKLTDQRQIPLVAVNTTAGTASEITKFAIITDEMKQVKISLVDESLIPDIAVDDPMLMINMPPKLTASTGMDAYTHAIEAYVAKRGNYITNCTALQAVRLIEMYLMQAYKKHDDLEARDGMVYAQYMAGMAFSNAGLGLVHAMAHQLGGLYNLPHGVCNAVLLPYVMHFNNQKVYARYAEIARAVNLAEQYTSDRVASNNLIRHIRELSSKMSLPCATKELGVSFEDSEKLAQMAAVDASLKDNPIEPKIRDIQKLFEDAYQGDFIR